MADAKPKTLTFTPEEPIHVGNAVHETLTFERLRVRHMVAMDKFEGKMRKTVAMFAAMADVPMPVIEELDMDDFERLSEELVPLMGKSARSLVEEREQTGADAEAPVH